MAWAVGVTRTTGDLITASDWNSFLGAGGNFDLLSDGVKIAASLVYESSMEIGNGPTNGLFLQAQSGQTGGLLWAAESAAANIDEAKAVAFFLM